MVAREMAGGGVALAIAVACLLGWRAGRQNWRSARWRRDHARRLPWALFLRRRAPLRLVDGRPHAPGYGPDRPPA